MVLNFGWMEMRMKRTKHPARRRITPSFSLCLLGLLAITTLLPATPSQGPVPLGSQAAPLTVDTSDRTDVLRFYHCVYQASVRDQDALIGWTGSLGTCTPGTTAQEFRDDVQRRINYYRAMAGIPADIEFDNALNAKAQAAALIMSEQGGLSHNPAQSFGTGGCWTAAGQEGAEKGNLALGSYGAESVDGYMEDHGGNNLRVGHRRWLIHPPQTTMGTGDIPDAPGRWATNTIYVIGSSTHRATNPNQGSFYSWPPAGFVPQEQVWPRWSLQFSTPSFGYPRFTSASVSMKRVSDQANVPVTIIYRYTGGGVTGDPAIVWEPNWTSFGGAPPVEEEFEVTVSGISSGGSGASSSYTYRVTPINQDVFTDELTLSGSATPSLTGESYSVTGISGDGADCYEVEVSSVEAGTWTEGAESSPAPLVIDGTGSAYDLATNLSPAFGAPGARSGTKAFHLAFPEFADQSFEIDRDILPGPTSKLHFWNHFRFAVSGTNRLRAELSTDGGGSWTELWSRSAGALSTSGWDKSWQGVELDLAAYAGQVVRLRFVYAYVSSAVLDTGPNAGCYLDDISVSDGSYLPTGTVTDLGASTSFTLNATTAGAPLVDGSTYFLRVRPIVGCKTFGWSDPVEVVATVPSGYAAWSYTATVGAFDQDYDGDRLANGLEYAFGLDPTDPSDFGDIPEPSMPAPGQLMLSITEPGGVSGLTYGAEWSSDVETWYPLTDSGTGNVHTFLASSAGPRLFVRWVVTNAAP